MDTPILFHPVSRINYILIKHLYVCNLFIFSLKASKKRILINLGSRIVNLLKTFKSDYSFLLNGTSEHPCNLFKI